jgi:signal transduction histidine kinase
MLKNLADEKEIVEIILYLVFFYCHCSDFNYIFLFFKKENYSKRIRKERLRNSVSKELLSAVIITQEEERKRIAQDLHDDISSKLNIVLLNSYLLTAPNQPK